MTSTKPPRRPSQIELKVGTLLKSQAKCKRKKLRPRGSGAFPEVARVPLPKPYLNRDLGLPRV